MEVVELSTGHVFAPGSVKVVGPLNGGRPDYDFEIIGVGFRITIHICWHDYDQEWQRLVIADPKDEACYDRCKQVHKAAAEGLRRQAIEKLLVTSP